MHARPGTPIRGGRARPDSGPTCARPDHRRRRARATLAFVTSAASPVPSFDVSLRVRYEETDADGVVYYANYLTYFEVARVEWLRALGYPIRRIFSEGIMLPVVEARLRYLRPAQVDDLLTVTIALGAVGPASLALDYEISRDDGVLLVTGWTRLAVCDRATGRACAIPQRLRTVFDELVAGAGGGDASPAHGGARGSASPPPHTGAER